MALFTLWRELDHTMDEAERENMTIRSIGSLEWYPGVHWLHSWVIDEPGRLESLCVYEGPNQQKVEEALMRCSVPFVEVREAQIFLPGDYLADEWNQPLGDKPFFTKCNWSPFAGWPVRGAVKQVFVRGQLAFDNGAVLARPGSGQRVDN